MAELKIDIDGINSQVIPQLNKAKTELESAANSLYAISYSPDYYGFTNRNRVQSVLPQNIRNIRGDVNDINKWLSDISSKFKEANQKSNNSVNSLLGKLDEINFSNSIGEMGSAIVGVTALSIAIEQNNFGEKVVQIAEILGKYVENEINSAGAKITSRCNSFCNALVALSNIECKAMLSDFTTSVIIETSKGIKNIKDEITSLPQKCWDKLCGMTQSVGDAFNSVGAYVCPAWKPFFTYVWPDVWDMIQMTGASAANGVIGFIKGLNQFVESLWDAVVILGTAGASTLTGGYDGISYLVSLSNGTSDEWKSLTETMWGNVMGYVAEDHVGNRVANFYKNNVVGQWLDEHAKNIWLGEHEINLFKSDGLITKISTEIGYTVGEILLTILTVGGSKVASPSAMRKIFARNSAFIAGISAFGKYTQEAWGNARDSSWEGVERLYQKGEITEEEYNNLIVIRSMTDEQFTEIENDYKDGKISEEEFELIKQIREMPEDWKTFENGLKGILHGTANAVWEGVQWYVGGMLSGWTMKGGSQLGSSIIRVVADTVFNASDTPFRALMDTIIYGKTWDQAWEEQGGWKSVVANLLIGLFFSIAGEVSDRIKSNEVSKIADELTAKNVNVNLNEVNLKNEILSKIPNIENETLIAKSLYEELNKKVHYDFEYTFGDNIKKQQIIDNTVNFSKLNEDSSVVCKGWSELYKELLDEKGIKCDIVQATNANHWWVQIYTKDGKIIVADATDRIAGEVDLVNSKIGSQTNGFFSIDSKQIGQRPSDIIKTQEQIDQITEIDIQLGYADKNGYRIDKMSDVNKMFESGIFEEFKKTWQYKKSLELLEIPEGIDGYEAFGYFLQLQQTNKDIKTNLLFMKNGDGIEPLCYTEINSDPPIYQIYGKTMNKVTFTNLQDMNEYINKLNIIKRK